jgi:hypothetical protein
MTITTGFVQRLTILKTGFACVYIGPNPTNVEALSISRVNGESASDLTWKNSMVSALITAMAAHQQLQVRHGDTDTEIQTVELGGSIF